MFNDDESRERTAALHREVVRQQQANAAAKAAAPPVQRAPADVRAQFAREGLRSSHRGADRRG